ncbi:hypothetical protein, partial [Corynebacterium sp. c24Ua_83]|uniref:hypothetical protein n=1 Tax=Corynebacterium sp. c24Ua_83 TaxID=3032350 RepID=UPI003264B56E
RSGVWVVVTFQRLQQPTPHFFYVLTHCGGKVGVNSKEQQHCASAASETKIDKVHGTGLTTRKDEDDGR